MSTILEELFGPQDLQAHQRSRSAEGDDLYELIQRIDPTQFLPLGPSTEEILESNTDRIQRVEAP